MIDFVHVEERYNLFFVDAVERQERLQDGCFAVVVVNVNLEAELIYLVSPDRVNVFHHEVPDFIFGIGDGRFDEFQDERFLPAGTVCGEFAHLVGFSAVGVFVGNAQDFVVVERGIERYIAE